MKQKWYWGILAVQAALCVLLVGLRSSMTGVFSTVMAFPFEQLGLGLRAASLSSSAGNAVAVLLYLLLCLSPCAALLWRRKRGLHLEDILLPVLSLTLLIVLYLMINPGKIGLLFEGAAAGLPAAKAMLGGTVYSIFCGYLVLRVLRRFGQSDTAKLQRAMSALLVLLGLLFVTLIFGVGGGELVDSFAALQAGNVGNEQLLGASKLFLVLRSVVDALPYALDIVVVLAASALLREMAENRYSAQTVAAAERLSRRCGIALTATVGSNVAFHLCQLLCARKLLVVNVSVQLPVFSIAFVLGTMLLSRLVSETKVLKDDSDSII